MAGGGVEKGIGDGAELAGLAVGGCGGLAGGCGGARDLCGVEFAGLAVGRWARNGECGARLSP